jgi:DNA-binding winged helix-turn-helix (wHTH) protein/Tfp pilus assembly protein PilF
MSSGENAHRVYRFDEYALDLDREALYRADRELHLRPKAFRVLRILLENSGRLVSKAELHEAVWKQSVVTDDSLAHCIADIRHALGENGFEMIKTVPRRGYVFDHAVRQETEQAVEPPPERTRIAYGLGAVTAGLVAAFLLLFGAGRGDEIPASGADTGEDGVATVLEVDPSSTNIDAFNESEKGRFFFKRRGKGDIDLAEACFEAALEQDPEFAAAWIGLAGVYSVRIGEGSLNRDEGLPLLGDATRHALRLAPDSAEAHVRRADYYSIRGVPLLARQHTQTALALDPDDVLVLGRAAGALLHGNRLDEAIELQRRAIQADPISVLQHNNLVWMLLAAGRYPEAAVAAEQYHALYPPGTEDSGELFASVEILQGNFEQALIQTRNMSNGPAQDRNLAIIHHALGQEAEAGSALQRLLADGSEQAAIHAAEVLAFRGEIDEALRRLSGVLYSPARDEPTRRQLHQDSLWLLSPYLIGLRSDERWQRLYARVLDARDHSIFLARADSADVISKE